MIVRVISDVHSNLHALEAVLGDPGTVADVTVCLGDVVGYGAFPAECVDLVRRTAGVVVAGNHDAGAAGLEPLDRFNPCAARAVVWTGGRLAGQDLAWLSGLPLTSSLEGLVLCHSQPADPSSFEYVDCGAKAARALAAHPGRVLLTGHTHVPLVWDARGGSSAALHGTLQEPCLIAAGSVGQPRDGDPRAACLLIDTEQGTWRHVRVSYDVGAAARAIRDAGLPGYLAARLFEGR